MSARYDDLEAAVLELPAAERMALAERIYASLPADLPEAIERQWIIDSRQTGSIGPLPQMRNGYYADDMSVLSTGSATDGSATKTPME